MKPIYIDTPSSLAEGFLASSGNFKLIVKGVSGLTLELLKPNFYIISKLQWLLFLQLVLALPSSILWYHTQLKILIRKKLGVN